MVANKHPTFSFIIPCFNEELYLEQAVEAIVSNGYPLDKIEILVVDGGSTDRTIDIAQSLSEKYSFLKVLNNPKRILAAAWNIGIDNATGDLIVAGNAHAKLENNHFTKCLEFFSIYDVNCVAPVLITHPQNDTAFGNAVAGMMCHRFGVGNSDFRVGSLTEPLYVDTAHLGAYKKDVFEDGVRYNEELLRSQDIELHRRLRLAGEKILLCPSIRVHYYTRSEPKGFLKFGFMNGYWVTKPWQFGVSIASVRHLTPLVFVLSIVIPLLSSLFISNVYFITFFVVLLYSILLLSVGLEQSFRKKEVSYLVLSPLVFATYHISYGIGSIVGITYAIFSTRFWGLIRRSLFGNL